MDTNLIENNRRIAHGILNNDQSAYAEFMNKYFKLVHYLCNKSSENECDADELCNDIMFKLFMKINTYDPGKGKLTTWINIIATNYLRDNMRKDDPSEQDVSIESYLENENIGEEPDTHEFFYAGSDTFPANDAFSRYSRDFDEKPSAGRCEDEEIIRLKNALKEISERDQQILKFRSEGFSYNEIAELLKISYKTATTAYSRAVKKVRAGYYKELAEAQKN